jgi:hypothetical protein
MKRAGKDFKYGWMDGWMDARLDGEINWLIG